MLALGTVALRWLVQRATRINTEEQAEESWEEEYRLWSKLISRWYSTLSGIV
jgi:hypothetical protein